MPKQKQHMATMQNPMVLTELEMRAILEPMTDQARYQLIKQSVPRTQANIKRVRDAMIEIAREVAFEIKADMVGE